MRNDLEKWLDFVEQDQNLSERLLVAKMEYEKQQKSLDDFICDKFIPEAKKYGFHFSFDDVVNFSNAYGLQELSLDDLQDVAGGISNTKALFAVSAIAVSLLTVIPISSMFKFNIGSENFSSITSSFSESNKTNTDASENVASPQSSFSKMIHDYVKLKNLETNSRGGKKQSTDVKVKDKSTEKIKNEDVSRARSDKVKKSRDVGTMGTNDDLVRQLRAQVQDLQRQLAESKEELETLKDEVENYKALASQAQREANEAKNALQVQKADMDLSEISEQKSQPAKNEIQGFQVETSKTKVNSPQATVKSTAKQQVQNVIDKIEVKGKKSANDKYNDIAIAEIDEAKKQIDTLKVQLSKEIASREKAEKAKAAADEQASKEKERADILDARVKKIEAQVVEKDKEIVQQRAKIKKLEAKLREMKQQLSDLKKQLEHLA